MRASAKIFWILGVFFLIVAIAYGFVTHRYEPHGIETAGFPAVLALSGLGFMIAMALTINARRHELDASDDLDGEVSESAGVQGSFSPYSWAPLWASLVRRWSSSVWPLDGGSSPSASSSPSTACSCGSWSSPPASTLTERPQRHLLAGRSSSP